MEKLKGDDYNGGYEIESTPDLEQCSTVEQLKYLSSVAEASNADTWYSIVGGGDRTLRNAMDDRNLPPITRIVAKILQSTIMQTEVFNDEDNDDFGYYSIVAPEQLPSYTDLDMLAQLSEEELKSEIHRLSEEQSKLPEVVYDGTGEENLFNEYGYISRDLELHAALDRKRFQKNQERLHREFPNLPKKAQLVKIASDAAATVEFQEKYNPDDAWFSYSPSIDLISMTPEANNKFKIDKDSEFYLKTVHGNNFLKSAINEILDIDISKISLGSQVHLLKFMAEAKNTRFDTLCDTMRNVKSEKTREKLLGGFLAADFGEDFGDGLLEIAGSERISGEQLEQILDSIESCRESIHGITELYAGFDDRRFANEYARAANERLTDAIMVFREIAKDGEAEADLGWFGEAKMDFDSALEALRLEEKSLGIINGTLGDVVIGKQGTFAETVLPPAYYSQFTLYNFYSPEHGYVMLYTRPEGSGTFDETIEYGKYRSKYDEHNNNAGVEASISLIVNPVDPFTLPKPYRPDRKKMRDFNYYDPSTMDKVSAIRLDREGRAPNAAVDDPDHNPMNAIGTISVDLAAINDRADTPSGKIARLFSVGNKIRGDMAGMDSTLNHNTHWFEQDRYGTAEGFKGLVEYIDSLVSIWCAERKPSKDSESFRKLMQAFKREAGRAA